MASDFATLMTAVIQYQIAIIGEKIALDRGRSISGVTVDDSGVVRGEPTQEMLAQLVETYRLVGGEVAVKLARKAIAPLLSGGEDLPANLLTNRQK